MKPARTNRTRFAAAATSVLLLTWTGVEAQKTSLAEVAAGLSGTWKVNRELSDALSDTARGGRRGGALFTTATPIAPQRGGGADAATNSDLTPDELAALAAMRELQRVSEIISVKASVDSVSFSDARGERTYPVNGKKVTLDIAGAKVNVKSSWDKNALKQEFSTPKATFRETWEVDQNNRLVLKAKLESMTMVSKELKTVFDRQ